MGEKEAKKGSAKATAEPTEPAEDSMPSTPPSGLRPFAPGQNSQTGEVHRRGPDRKPRKVARLTLLRAFVSGKQRNGKPVTGLEDLALGLRELMANHGVKNFPNLLRLMELTKEVFDDAPDSGSGRTTVFLFPSEVEAEMKNGGPLHSGERRVPDGPPGPLAGMEEAPGASGGPPRHPRRSAPVPFPGDFEYIGHVRTSTCKPVLVARQGYKAGDFFGQYPLYILWSRFKLFKPGN